MTNPYNIIAPFPLKLHPDSYLKAIGRRENYTYKRSNFMTISGSSHRKTGTGKSWTGLRYGEYNDPEYREGSARKVVYNIADFMEIIGELEDDYNRAPRRTIGQTIIVDEAGSLISSTAWQQATNRAMKYVIETCRYLRIGALLIMPQRRGIDKNVRTMADYHISMKMTLGKNGGKPLHLSTAYALYYDEWQDETKRRTLKGYGLEGNYKYKTFPLKDVPISPVQSQELIANYEKKQIKYKMQLRELMANDIKNYEKQLAKDPTLPQIDDIAHKIVNDEELIRDMVVNRKADTTLLEVTIEKNFPDYSFTTNQIKTLKKILDKLIIGKR